MASCRPCDRPRRASGRHRRPRPRRRTASRHGDGIVRGAVRGASNAIHDRYGSPRPGGCRAEPNGSQRASHVVNEMARWRQVRLGSATNHIRNRARRQRHGHDAGSFGRPVPRREDHALAVGQHLGPQVVGFAFRRIDLRQHLRLASAGRHATKPLARRCCEHDRVVRSPTATTERAIEGTNGLSRSARNGDSFQRVVDWIAEAIQFPSGEKKKPPALGAGNERPGSCPISRWYRTAVWPLACPWPTR